MSVFLSRARALLDANDILTGEDVSSRSSDPLKIVETRAQAILRPRNTSQIVAIMRLASKCGQTIVLHGGRTGVSGGAYAESSDVVISLERMNAIEDIDTVNHTIVAQAGVTLQQLQDAAAEHGMYYPVDLGARGTATVGGMIATNAGGNRTLRWGMTRDRVLGLEVILPMASSFPRCIAWSRTIPDTICARCSSAPKERWVS
jgi:FAD/FMN-containing dehydrogenase